MKERLPPPKKLAAVLLVLLLVTSGVYAASEGVSWHSPSTTSSVYDAPDGPTITESAEMTATSSVPIRSGVVDFGIVEFRGDASATLSAIDSGEISLSQIDAGTGGLQIHHHDTQRVDVSGSVTSITFGDVNLASTAQEVSVSGSGSVDIHGLPSSESVVVVHDTRSDEIVQTDASGVASIDVQDGDSFSVRSTADPVLDEESANPQGGETVSETPVELSIDVSDPDFDTAQGDVVEVVFEARHVDDNTWNTVGTSTITENQTLNETYSPATLGTQEWRVTATDDYGNEVTSQTFTFQTPQTVTVRNETNPQEILDTNTETTFRFFGDEEVFTRTSTDGTINMTGLPNEQFTLEVSVDGNFSSRTVHIDSIYNQQEVYLLHDSVESIEARFLLDDPTGNFGPETTLYIEKPIEINGSTTYQTIVADSFGAEGVTAQLERDQRYRLKIRSESGITQIIGPYRAAASETVEVSPGQPSIGIGESQETWSVNTGVDNTTLEYRYDDAEGLTSQLTVRIYERHNESNELVPEESFFELGTASNQVEMTENESEKSWIVEFEITRDGETFTVTRPADGKANLVPELSDTLRLIVAIGLLFLSAGAFSILNAGVGAVVVSLQGGVLWWIGWLEGATAGAAVVIALFISVLVAIYKSSGP